jgi:hypothetical protein
MRLLRRFSPRNDNLMDSHFRGNDIREMGMTESNLRLPRPDKSELTMTENIYPSIYIDTKKRSFYYTLTKII